MLLFQKKVQAVAATAEAKFGAKPIKVQQTAHTGRCKAFAVYIP